MALCSYIADECEENTMGKIMEHVGDEVDISAAEVAQEMLVVDGSGLGVAKSQTGLDGKK